MIKDVQSGNVGVVNTRLAVPRYEDEKLEASSLILADQLEHVPAKQIGTGQFVLGSSKVRPRLESDFTTADKLGNLSAGLQPEAGRKDAQVQCHVSVHR